MRENALRNNSSFRERGDNRSNQGKPNRPPVHRSKRSINLGRLGSELGMDVLGAALGLTDEAIRILVDGRDHAREEQYATHLIHRLKDAGISPGWLERPYSPLAPEYVRKLREFAAESLNKAPIRRFNFSRLATAFADRPEVLADALEMVPSSIANVAEGLLEFDDYRFGHINPRLMRAGFPDGWLERPEPDLTDAMISELEQLATDDYERHLADNDYDLLENAEYQAHVSPAPAQVTAVASSMRQDAAPIKTSKETKMAPAKPQQPKTTAEKPSVSPEAPLFPAGGIPGATKPMPHPSAVAKIPRSVLASGRKLTGAAIKPAAPVVPAAPVAQAKPKVTDPVATKAPTESVRRTTAPRGTVTKEVSLVRANALQKLLEQARRGVKVTLWRDILGSSLPFWGNVRRGTVLFRNDLAEGVVRAMGLPEGWLDNPSFPPATLAAWVTNPDAPVPTAMEVMGTAPQPTLAPAPQKPANPAKPFARSKAPSPGKVTMTQPPAAPPEFPAASAPVEATVAPTAEVSLPQVVEPSVAPVAVAPTPAPVEVAPAVEAPKAEAFPAAILAAQSWPTTKPGQVGPLGQALLTILAERAANGTLSEAEALNMINALVAH